jgi:hypothetical protein
MKIAWYAPGREGVNLAAGRFSIKALRQSKAAVASRVYAQGSTKGVGSLAGG